MPEKDSNNRDKQVGNLCRESAEAWNAFFPTLKCWVRSAIQSFKFDDSTQDDFIMEVALTVMEKGAFDNASHCEGFIKTTARNKAVDFIRRRDRAEKYGEDIKKISQGDPKAGDAQMIECEAYLRRQQLENLICDTLTDDEQILYSYLRDGFTPGEIASKLKITRGTADTRISRLRKKLRDLRSQLD